VHVGDPIPSIPPASLGFKHPGPEYVIHTATLDDNTSANDVSVRVQSDAADTSDADGDIVTPSLLMGNWGDQWKAHSWYFGAITICYNGGILSDLTTPFKNDPDANPSLDQ
jgi:hypothetical protein